LARILFFVFLAFLVWLAVRILGAKRTGGEAAPPSSPPPAVEAITQCAWCGVHVPTGSAVALPDGRIYCGPVHRDAARAAAVRP
jgi:uncharacterized protein